MCKANHCTAETAVAFIFLGKKTSYNEAITTCHVNKGCIAMTYIWVISTGSKRFFCKLSFFSVSVSCNVSRSPHVFASNIRLKTDVWFGACI